MKTSAKLKQPVEMPTDFELVESNGTILAKFSDWTSKCRVADLTDCEYDDYKEQALVIGRKIVKAINAHDELAEILSYIMDDMPEDWKRDEKAWSIGLMDRARAALAKLAD